MSSKTVLNFPKGSIIYMENTPNPGYIYILKSGEIAIRSYIKFSSMNLHKYVAGDTFGFVSALTRNPHDSTLIASVDCVVIRLTIDSFIEYLRSNKDVFLKFITISSSKLRTFLEKLEPNSLELKASPEKLFKMSKEFEMMNERELSAFALKKYLTCEFSTPKNPEILKEAEDLLKKIRPGYEFPAYKEYIDGSGIVYPKGSIIFAEGEPNDYFYLVVKGRIKISKVVDNKEMILGLLDRGEIFGEMAILNKQARAATAVAHEETVLRKYSADTLLETEDDILVKILQIIARRLWKGSQRVFIMQLNDLNLKLYAQLNILIADEIANDEQKSSQKSFTFQISFEELKQMANIVFVDDSSDILKEIMSDKNIQRTQDTIRIQDKSVFESKFIALKKRYSQS